MATAWRLEEYDRAPGEPRPELSKAGRDYVVACMAAMHADTIGPALEAAYAADAPDSLHPWIENVLSALALEQVRAEERKRYD